jgi:PAS domain S-box-containing protein
MWRPRAAQSVSKMATDKLQVAADLGMRVRELSLLHDVAAILQRDELVSMGDCLAEITCAIQRSWPHPDVVGVHAQLGTVEVSTPNLAALPVRYRAEFVIADDRTGAFEVACGSDRSETSGSDAAQALLDDVAEMFRTAVDRRLAMTALRQSEQRYRSVVEQQSDLVCRFLPDTTLTFVNEAYCRFFSKTRDELIGRRFIELIPEAERQTALDHIASVLQGGAPGIAEHNVLLPDGTLGRQQWVDHAIASSDGSVEELQGIGRDITAHWRVEEALRQKEASLREAYDRIRSLAHRLMLAQEAERTEIARDLHDDVGQQLAALGIGLTLIDSQITDNTAARAELAKMRHLAVALAEKVRHVSHALHPGVLKHAGLSAAIAGHCEAVANQSTFAVQFEGRGAFSDTPSDVALCLYRAVQQALRNVAMHAGATRAWVSLVREDGRIDLMIADNGRGFDLTTAHARGGLGLLSIEERVHLLNGSFAVDTRVGSGSRLTISIPITWA